MPNPTPAANDPKREPMTGSKYPPYSADVIESIRVGAEQHSHMDDLAMYSPLTVLRIIAAIAAKDSEIEKLQLLQGGSYQIGEISGVKIFAATSSSTDANVLSTIFLMQELAGKEAPSKDATIDDRDREIEGLRQWESYTKTVALALDADASDARYAASNIATAAENRVRVQKDSEIARLKEVERVIANNFANLFPSYTYVDTGSSLDVIRDEILVVRKERDALTARLAAFETATAAEAKAMAERLGAADKTIEATKAFMLAATMPGKVPPEITRAATTAMNRYALAKSQHEAGGSHDIDPGDRDGAFRND